MVLQTLGWGGVFSANTCERCLWKVHNVWGGLMLNSSTASKKEGGIPDIYFFVYLFIFNLVLKKYMCFEVFGV